MTPARFFLKFAFYLFSGGADNQLFLDLKNLRDLMHCKMP